MAVIYYAAMISHRALIRIFPKVLSHIHLLFKLSKKLNTRGE